MLLVQINTSIHGIILVKLHMDLICINFVFCYSEKSSLEELFIAPVKSSLNESKNSKSIEFLDGSFKTTSRVNGIDLEEDFSNVKKDKVSRMLSGQIDKEILKGFESKLSSSARSIEERSILTMFF